MGKKTRRFFLGTGLVAAGAAGASVLACGGLTEQAAWHRLDILLPRMRDPVRVGLASRAAFGLDHLLQAAEAHGPIATALRTECPATRLDTLATAIRADFAARDIVLCDRFVMARTEGIVAGLRLDQALTLAPRA